jgi:lipoprotein-anchoring transpeptidase ErfK/SrfK
MSPNITGHAAKKIMPKIKRAGRFMRLLSGWRAAVMAAGVLSLLSIAPAFADVVVHIDKSSQRMSVSVNGQPRYTWPVSTGRGGYGTPSGVFQPQMMAQRWFSKKYYNSPMPHSIFFYHGYAIHGTTDIRRLGGPASHGCVRLHPSNAATLYALVERNGRGNTRIEIY